MKIDKYVERYTSIAIAVSSGVFLALGMMIEAVITIIISILMMSGILFKGLENETKK